MAENRDLRASLLRIGPQLPGLSLDGVLLDGRKKATMCAELGLHFEIVEAQTLTEACSVLWSRHPSRALELAGKRNVLELAQLCGATPTAIAKQLAADKPKKSHHKRILNDAPFSQLKTAPKMKRVILVIEPELHAYAREAAAQIGHRNFSKLARDALWEKIALLVPNAPQFQPRRVQAPNGARAHRRRTG